MRRRALALLGANLFALCLIIMLLWALSPRRAQGADNDAGFMRMRSGAPKCWTRADIPVSVVVAPDADAHYMHDTADAVRVINRVLGFVAYAAPARATVDYVQRFHREARGFLGVVLIQADLVDDRRAGAYLNTFPNGIIRSVFVVLPANKPSADMVLAIVHELLHGLGLDHDGNARSIMHERLSPGQVLTRADYRRLVEAYR